MRSEDRLVIAESDAHLIADYVRFFARERENVGQEGFDALVHRVSPPYRLSRSLADSPSPSKVPRRAEEGPLVVSGAPRLAQQLRQLGDVEGDAPRLVAGEERAPPSDGPGSSSK